MSASIWNPSGFLGILFADAINFLQAGAGAVVRTVQSKLRDTVNVRDFGAQGLGDPADYSKIVLAVDYCRVAKKNLLLPEGVWNFGAANGPFKNPEFPATSILDFNDITIMGEGPNTILMTESVDGADVINLYYVKNLHFRNLKIKAILTGFAGAGSNGVSFVGGLDNITFDKIWCEDLPYVDKGTYLDGGKAFTVQPGTPAETFGNIKLTNIYAKGCVHGFGLEVDLVNWNGKIKGIQVTEAIFEDCYAGVVVSAGAASGALPAGMTMGLSIDAQIINCQRTAILSRSHGCDIELTTISTKTAAQKRLNPSGGTWNSADSIVGGLLCAYAKDSTISIIGDLGACDYKVELGAATAGSSGQGPETENCVIYVDLGGTAAISSLRAITLTGADVKSCKLDFTLSTTNTIPTTFYTDTKNNQITLGTATRLNAPSVVNGLGFVHTDGQTVYTSFARDTLGIFASQTGGASNDVMVLGVKNHAGAKKFFVRNDGALASSARNTATSVSTVKQVMPIYDESNVLVGYIPIYTSFA